MIQIGIPEILLISIIAILFIKPNNLVNFIQGITKFFLRFRANVENIKEEAEKTLNIQELKQDVFNEQKMKSFDNDRKNE